MVFNAKLESCKISTTHTTELAIQDRDRNHNAFIGHITMPPFIAPTIKGMTKDAMQGLTITNKNCYWKRPEYNQGPWETQITPYDGEVQFNVQTKRKVNRTPVNSTL